MTIFKEFTFDSAHFLPMVPPEHKCRGMHGHTYRLTIFIEGDPHPVLGWVMDFAEIKEVMAPIINAVDHKMLNDVPGLENPTCELLAHWLWQRIKPAMPLLSKITLYETPTSGVICTG